MKMNGVLYYLVGPEVPPRSGNMKHGLLLQQFQSGGARIVPTIRCWLGSLYSSVRGSKVFPKVSQKAILKLRTPNVSQKAIRKSFI